MKPVLKILLFLVPLFYFHNLAAQSKKSIELSMISKRPVNNALVTTRQVFKIDKDSVRNEVYKDGKLFTKTVADNKPGEFYSTILDLDSAAWYNIAYQSTIMENCDTAYGLSVNYVNAGIQSNFWVRQSGNCYPESIKAFVKRIFELFKQD